MVSSRRKCSELEDKCSKLLEKKEGEISKLKEKIIELKKALSISCKENEEIELLRDELRISRTRIDGFPSSDEIYNLYTFASYQLYERTGLEKDFEAKKCLSTTIKESFNHLKGVLDGRSRDICCSVLQNHLSKKDMYPFHHAARTAFSVELVGLLGPGSFMDNISNLSKSKRAKFLQNLFKKAPKSLKDMRDRLKGCSSMNLTCLTFSLWAMVLDSEPTELKEFEPGHKFDSYYHDPKRKDGALGTVTSCIYPAVICQGRVIQKAKVILRGASQQKREDSVPRVDATNSYDSRSVNINKYRDHFIFSPSNTDKAQCKICSKFYACGTNVGNLKCHLKIHLNPAGKIYDGKTGRKETALNAHNVPYRARPRAKRRRTTQQRN
mmetsp:Transcript_41276/g.67096  ORF Transcript_41276/g.67096 Transcript_41276/m.67096 type:complete len:382 (+) Transcript_41276:72-1217(+)